MPQAWRIVKARRVSSAFDGEGARLNGGRWNSVGTPTVYLSAAISLAALEMLVNLGSSDLLLSYVKLPISFDSEMVRDLDESLLPPDWAAPAAPAATQQIGDSWVASGASALLRVPSAIIAEEHNFLLNPRHPDFARVSIGPPTPFSFDSRLK